MDFQSILAAATEFAKARLSGHEMDLDSLPEQPLELYKVFAEQGLANWWIPKEYGGHGLTMEQSVSIVSALARGDAGFAFATMISGFTTTLIHLYGEPSFRNDVLSEIVKGGHFCSVAVTEESIGSEILRVGTTARRDGDEYVITGLKFMSTSADFASHLFVLCQTPDKGEQHNYRIVIVPRASKGVRITKRWDVVGLRSAGVYEVELKDCRVPVINALTADGLRVFEAGLNIGRTLIGSLGIGIGRRAVDLLIEYGSNKIVKGRPLVKNDVFAHQLGLFYVDIVTMESLCLRAARYFDELVRQDGANRLITTRTSDLATSSKLVCARLSTAITTKAATMMGSYGYCSECPLDKLVRDAKVISILEGGEEILCEYLYKSFVLSPRTANTSSTTSSSEIFLMSELDSAPENEKSDVLRRCIKQLISETIGLDDPEALSDNQGLFDIGMDSIMAVSFKDRLQRELGENFSISSTLVFDYPTVDDLHQYVSDLLGKSLGSISGQASTRQADLSDDDTINQLMAELGENKPVKQPEGKWVIQQSTGVKPRLRLFCFHFSGGGPSAFKRWRELLPDDIDLCLIQLPGREQRRREPLITDAAVLMTRLVKAVTPLLDIPVAFYGHSIGGFFASEVARHLQLQGLPIPKRMVFSCIEPFYVVPGAQELPVYDTMSDDEMMADLIERYSGIPEFILNDPALLKIFLPILRADVSLYQQRVELAEKLKVPITTITCTEDKGFAEQDIIKWELCTEGPYKNVRIPGGHFRILDDPQPFISILLDECQRMD